MIDIDATLISTADHIEIVELVLDPLPRQVVEHPPIVVRADRAAHEFTDEPHRPPSAS